MKQKIVPRGKYVLVRSDEEESRENSAGLIIPTNVEQEKKAFGTVEAVGSEIKDIKKGDRVVYGLFAGETVKTEENSKEVELKLLYDDDIIAFLK